MAQGDAWDRVLGCYDPPRGSPAFISSHPRLSERSLRLVDRHGEHRQSPAAGRRRSITCSTCWPAGTAMDLTSTSSFRSRPSTLATPISRWKLPMFRSVRAIIEPHWARIRVQVQGRFRQSSISPKDTAAMCVSRPTNPSGNVLADAEIARLARSWPRRTTSRSSSTTPMACRSRA